MTAALISVCAAAVAFCRDELVTAVVAAPTPDGVTAVRVDVYPKSKQLDIGVSPVLC
jgi:hypothetical protein